MLSEKRRKRGKPRLQELRSSYKDVGTAGYTTSRSTLLGTLTAPSALPMLAPPSHAPSMFFNASPSRVETARYPAGSVRPLLVPRHLLLQWVLPRGTQPHQQRGSRSAGHHHHTIVVCLQPPPSLQPREALPEQKTNAPHQLAVTDAVTAPRHSSPPAPLPSLLKRTSVVAVPLQAAPSPRRTRASTQLLHRHAAPTIAPHQGVIVAPLNCHAVGLRRCRCVALIDASSASPASVASPSDVQIRAPGSSHDGGLSRHFRGGGGEGCGVDVGGSRWERRRGPGGWPPSSSRLRSFWHATRFGGGRAREEAGEGRGRQGWLGFRPSPLERDTDFPLPRPRNSYV